MVTNLSGNKKNTEVMKAAHTERLLFVYRRHVAVLEGLYCFERNRDFKWLILLLFIFKEISQCALVATNTI